jgi:hypothetical protein
MAAIDRRRFLRLAGAGVGAAVLTACSRPSPGPEHPVGRAQPEELPIEPTPPSPLTAEERYVEGMLGYLAGFADWLGDASGFVGEVGWRGEGEDAAEWDALGRQWLEAAADLGFWVTYWASGPWPPDYELLAHEGNPLHRTRYPGRALEQASRPFPESNGVNLAGWEWDDDNFPRAGSFRYLAERDITLVRIPFAWERLQPVTFEPLDDVNVRRMRAVCAWAHAAGCQVILDCHNYEQVHYWSGGDPRLMTTEEFVDLWTRLSARLKGQPGVAGYGLMNEPNPATGSDAQQWEQRAQACVTAIRESGDDQRIFVGTFHWSNIDSIAIHHPNGPWIDDPANRTVYEVHQYFDLGDGGTYPHSYDEYVDRWARSL